MPDPEGLHEAECCDKHDHKEHTAEMVPLRVARIQFGHENEDAQHVGAEQDQCHPPVGKRRSDCQLAAVPLQTPPCGGRFSLIAALARQQPIDKAASIIQARGQRQIT